SISLPSSPSPAPLHSGNVFQRQTALSHTHRHTHTPTHIRTHSHTPTLTLHPSHTCVAPEKSLKLSTTNYRAVSSASANAGGTLREGSDMQYVNLSNYSTLSILERLHLDSQT